MPQGGKGKELGPATHANASVSDPCVKNPSFFDVLPIAERGGRLSHQNAPRLPSRNSKCREAVKSEAFDNGGYPVGHATVIESLPAPPRGEAA
jgi:hypothetical protein